MYYFFFTFFVNLRGKCIFLDFHMKHLILFIKKKIDFVVLSQLNDIELKKQYYLTQQIFIVMVAVEFTDKVGHD